MLWGKKKLDFCGCVLDPKLHMCNDSYFTSILGQVILFEPAEENFSSEKLSMLL